MSRDYQQQHLESFFSTLPGVSRSTCQSIAAKLFSLQGHQPVKIESAPSQGSFSYTCVADVPYGASSRTIIQFRREELDLQSTHAIHGSIVPLVTFHGVFDRLLVYMSPLAQGERYINTLMSPEGEPAIYHRIQTATDLAPLFVRLSTNNVPRPSDTQSILSNLEFDLLLPDLYKAAY
jgi:hypothetical protein